MGHPWAPHPWAPHPWSMHPWHFDVSNNRNRSDVAELEALLKSWERVLFNESAAEMKKSGLNVSRVALENFPIWPVHPLAPHPFAPHPWAPHAWAPHPWAPHPWAPHPWSMHPWHFDVSNNSNHSDVAELEALLRSWEQALFNESVAEMKKSGLNLSRVALENFPIWPVHPLAPHPSAPHPWAPHAWAPHPWAPHPWAPHPWSMHPWHFDASNNSNRSDVAE